MTSRPGGPKRPHHGGGHAPATAPVRRRSSGGDSGSDDDGKTAYDDSAASASRAGGTGGAPVDDEPPMFKVEKLDWRPTREQGQLVSLSVGSNVLLMGTELNCTCVRWNVETDEFEEISLSRRPEDKIHKVFIDPTGHHSLASLTNGNCFYLHSRSTKAMALTKVKGFVIESVAWNNANGNETSTKKILLGTNKGHIYEALIEDKEKHCKKVYDLNEVDSKESVPISGLRIEMFPQASDAEPEKYFVMAATPTRHYQFIGGPTFEDMFKKYASNPVGFVELPASLGYSELRFFSKYQGRAKACASETCAWMTGAGIYYGNLVFGSQDQPGDRVVDDGKLLSYPEWPEERSGSSPAERKMASVANQPLSLILTEFHFLLLQKRKLVAINKLSEEIVWENLFDTSVVGEMKGLCPDPRKDTVWMFSNKFVFEVEIESEDRDVWKLYLQERNFSEAKKFANNEAEREQVKNAEADYYFSERHYERAAKCYSETTRSFEEITLKFVNIGREHPEARRALKIYLLEKLSMLPAQDFPQQTMICTWLTEIYLDNLNSLQDTITSVPDIHEDGTISRTSVPIAYPIDPQAPPMTAAARQTAREEEEKEFKEFITEWSDCLQKVITFELISSHGRINELLHFAQTIGDWEWVLNHHIQHRSYRQALKILRESDSPSKIAELYYKFAPTLIAHLPRDTVDMLIAVMSKLEGKQTPLDAAKLIPALMRYESVQSPDDQKAASASSPTSSAAGAVRKADRVLGNEAKEDKATTAAAPAADDEETNHAIRFLKFCVKRGRNKDPAIHNYLVSLLAKQPGETKLLQFIDEQKTRPLYDYKYALRLCHQEKKVRACVGIYQSMELFEEAVKLALDVDLRLAKSVVSQSKRLMDKQENKRLWLLIARRVIENGSPISTAMSLLKECDLKLEDILPYFPDFVRIGDFKEEIVKSLEAYNTAIESLKTEMDGYTDTANKIRKDIGDLRNRSGFITSNQRCDICSQPVLTRQFFLFPCTHVFHLDCIVNDVNAYLNRNPRKRREVLAMELEGKDDKLTTGGGDREREAAVAAARATGRPIVVVVGGGGGSGTATPMAGGLASFESNDVREARERRLIEQFAACECVFCGDIMIESVQDPFISLPNEDAEVRSWEIYHD